MDVEVSHKKKKKKSINLNNCLIWKVSGITLFPPKDPNYGV